MATGKKDKNGMAVQLICHEVLISKSLKKKEEENGGKMYVRFFVRYVFHNS